MSCAGSDHFISTQNVRSNQVQKMNMRNFVTFLSRIICGSTVFLKRILAEMVVDEIVIMLSYSAKNLENRGFFSIQSCVL